jgi:predicted ATPase
MNRSAEAVRTRHVREGDEWAAVNEGELDHGIEVLRAGVAAWRKAGARLRLPLFLVLEAEAYAKEGRIEAALGAIEQAIAISEETGERW